MAVFTLPGVPVAAMGQVAPSPTLTGTVALGASGHLPVTL